ncbi:MAG: hypothetical protein AAF533_29795 [Acidobacteriota bacterium]
MTRSEPTAHPDEAALEAHRTGEGSADVARHLEGCAACLQRLELLETLEAELGHGAPLVSIPTERDEALRSLLTQGAADLRRRRRGRVLTSWVLPAAACLLVGVGLVSLRERRQHETASEAPAMMASTTLDRRDLTGDGSVDVLDAFALARWVESGRRLDPAWDFTGDQVVDRRDADALVRDVVRLSS